MDTGQTLVTKQHGLLHTFVDVWLSEILSHIQISLTAHMSRVTWRVRWVVCNHLLSSVPALGKPTLLYIPTTLSSQELHGDPTRQSLSIMTLLQVMEARRSWRMGGTHCTRLCVQLPKEGHPGGLQLRWITNKAAHACFHMNTRLQFSVINTQGCDY